MYECTIKKRKKARESLESMKVSFTRFIYVPGFVGPCVSVNLLGHAHKVFETGLIEAVKDEARLTL